MIWQKLRGHQSQIEMFRRAFQRGRNAHAYLFVGPSGVGKKLFANLLAQCLFCEQIPDDKLDACGECSACRQMQAGTHPDLLYVGCPEGKRTFPISLIVGDNENRGREGLCHDLAMRPMIADRRIAILDDVETMNVEAANAFLKTLEEPPPGTIIFLIAPEVDLILPTIRSRCQLVRFSPLSDEDLKTLLLEHEIVETPAQAEELLPFAEGNLGLVRQLVDSDLNQLRATVERSVKKMPIDSLPSVKAITAVFDDLGGDTSKQRQYLVWVNRFLIESFRRDLRTSPDAVTSDRLGAMLDRCFEAELHMRQSMPVPLCLEALFDDLARISRSPVPVV